MPFAYDFFFSKNEFLKLIYDFFSFYKLNVNVQLMNVFVYCIV